VIARAFAPFERSVAHIPGYYLLDGSNHDGTLIVYDALQAARALRPDWPALRRVCFLLLTAGRGGSSRGDALRDAFSRLEAELDGSPVRSWAELDDAPAWARLDQPVAARDVFDLGDAFCMAPLEVFALKYAARAGKKPGEPYQKDLSKALESLQRRLQHLGQALPIKGGVAPRPEPEASWFSSYA
jgi:hypothetical protein